MSPMITGNKNKWLTLLLTSLLIGVAVFFMNTKMTQSEKGHPTSATLFVHGYKGGQKSFGPMIERFETMNENSNHMLIYVHDNGKLAFKTPLSKGQHTFIQLLFENNRASLDQQTKWLQSVMYELKQSYHIDQIQLVGHSMGGMAAVKYLMNNQSPRYPSVEKLAVIASPFGGIRKKGYFNKNYGAALEDLKPGSAAQQNFIKRKQRLDQEVDVLAIAGVINKSEAPYDHWDGLVHLDSVKKLKSIISKEQYEEEIIYGIDATHSGLHEHPTVDRVLQDFLWKNSEYEKSVHGY
ncbi:alpha/beta hydrolase [Halobacillus yeomjeoni]|uniref:Alpha/beta hydrolase n=1 Tax=Halobacillus yeomjeoni TaxID=311194 RepID=A0A931HY89_9BACI|nr:alpha/beta hydrolase [Halobacillus yeomjeoni]MBH0231623.1 alpha/beta hydrolase [Halobacillus yeomjeoni]